jgi:DNA invertase Pin-like site-specific DNA recombinase
MKIIRISRGTAPRFLLAFPAQPSNGWRLIPGRYDDGAFSGASLDRPALQQLLADVRASTIDIVLVYKVDRLTRSLADFAKLIELFDAHEVPG